MSDEPAGAEGRPRWWVLDLPVWTDWLWWLGLGVGAVSAATALAGRKWYETSAGGSTTLAASMVILALLGVVATWTLGGIVREFVRGRRGAGGDGGSTAGEGGSTAGEGHDPTDA